MQAWFERSFPSGLPLAEAPGVFSRMRQAMDRLDGAVRDLPAPLLTYQPGGRWSIQEHTGHLIDLEALLERRLDDFDRGAPVLQAADLQNRQTHAAKYNEQSIQDLLASFRRVRTGMVGRLERMGEAELARVSLHPRLQQPMSVVDLCFFVAEHDDHHLGTIAEVTAAARSMPLYALDLLHTVEATVPRLLEADDERSSIRPAAGKWSPKEIIGHLIDSASNNHQRFVRAMFQQDLVFPGYTQDHWVASQRYQDAPWGDLVTLWASFNRHMARVMAAVPEELRLKLRHPHNLDVLACHPVAADQPATLDYFMADYVWHVHHHLKQIPFLAERR